VALTLASAIEDVLTKAQEATGIKSLATGRHGTLPRLQAYPATGVVDWDAFSERTIKHTVALELHYTGQDVARAIEATMPYVDALLDEFAQDEAVGTSGWKVESVTYEYAYMNGKDGRETLGPVLNITVYGTEGI
jgi:hypothetical protein